MRKFFAICLGISLLGLITPPLASAQNGRVTVSGVVVDAAGLPIVGATVVEKGTVNGVSTDLNGAYSLNVSDANSVVEVSFIGYKTVELVATSSLLKELTLEEDLMSLDEVVVIGYGTVKKNDLTGSVATVKADQTNKGMISSPTDMLRGKSAGVVITSGSGAPGSGATIRIRGGSSLSATNDPLVVIDGLPVSNTGISGTSNPLASINPSDIESFTVLKDASATAIYGSRASNGVIIITTKKGARQDSAVPNVSVDFTASLSQNPKYVDVMTGDEMRQAIEWYYGGTDNDAYRALGNANTDWQREIFRLGQTYDGNISLTGNVKLDEHNRLPYRVSFGYFDQQGTLLTSHMARETLSLNLNPVLLDEHLTINLNAKGMNMDTKFADEGAVGGAVRFDPTQPVYSDDPDHSLNGYYAWKTGGSYNSNATWNPVAQLLERNDRSNAKRLVGNAQIDYKIHGLEDLRLNMNLGLDFSRARGTNDAFAGSERAYQEGTGGNGSHTYYSQVKRDQTIEFYADYAKTIGDHSFEIMGGYSWQHFYEASFNKTHMASDVPSSAPNYWISDPTTWRSEYFLVSFFGRLNYSYNNRYMVTATLRDDGTSRFANNKWGWFPSVAVGWNIAEESFLRDRDTAVSALKLRLSWGQTGQQDINAGNYPSLATYKYNSQSSQYQFGDRFYYPITAVGYNADLKWETTTTYNAGIDYGFLNGRLFGTLDFYFRKTTDLINYTPVAAGANLKNYMSANIGDLQNIGVEFEINAIPIQTKDWNWTIGFNTAWNKNKITRLTADDEREDFYGVETGGISGGVGSNIQVHQTGYPTNSFYVYQQVYDMNGNPIEGQYVDRNGDGKVDAADKYIYKKAAPDVTFGFNTQVSWKALTLMVSAHANVGNYVYDNISSNGELLTDLWTNSFVSNRVPSAVKTNFAHSAQYWSDYYVKNASFLKLDNITLSYRFDLGKAMDRNLYLHVFGTVQNVATLTGYKGLDPEIFSGIDNNMYPRPRTYILGVKFNF